MKEKKFLVYVLLWFCFLVPALASDVDAQINAERDVRKLERRWLDAYETHDAKAMDEIVAEEFFIVFSGGEKQTKPQLIAQTKQPANPNRSMKFHTEDVKAKVSGEKVVLTGRVISEVIVDGKVVSSSADLYTDTYVKRNGKWQVIESHLTKPTDK